MSGLNLKVKLLHPNAKVPSKAHHNDAAFDLTAVSRSWDNMSFCWVYEFGLAMEIPSGHVGLIFPRSSIFKTNLQLSNAVGVIDENYRGSVKAYFREQMGFGPNTVYNPGDRIAQIIILPIPAVTVTVVEQLSESNRGEGGFGSTGK